MRLESIRVTNFKALQDVHISKVTNMTVVVGKNGVGKTTFFDIFGFLHDCLDKNVNKALAMRGGFKEVVSRDKQNEKISFEVKFRSGKNEPLVTYELEISNSNGKPIVSKEVLRFRRGSKGMTWKMLEFSNGAGFAVEGNPSTYEEVKDTNKRTDQNLESADILAIKGFGLFCQGPFFGFHLYSLKFG